MFNAHINVVVVVVNTRSSMDLVCDCLLSLQQFEINCFNLTCLWLPVTFQFKVFVFKNVITKIILIQVQYFMQINFHVLETT